MVTNKKSKMTAILDFRFKHLGNILYAKTMIEVQIMNNYKYLIIFIQKSKVWQQTLFSIN